MTAPRPDRTTATESAYGSDHWCALTLGKSDGWFRKNRPRLEREGFPPKDGLLALTLKADVEAWLARRRVVADRVHAHTTGDHHTEESFYGL